MAKRMTEFDRLEAWQLQELYFCEQQLEQEMIEQGCYTPTQGKRALSDAQQDMLEHQRVQAIQNGQL